MGYRLNLLQKITDSQYTLKEIKAATGMSRVNLERMQRKNDAKFSDLYALAQLLDCDVTALYEESEAFECPKDSRVRKYLLRQERKEIVCRTLMTHLPDDIRKMQELMKITEADVCQRLWDNSFSERAQARIVRLTGDESYLPELLKKVTAIKDVLQ